MSETTNSVKLTATQDRRIAWHKGGSLRYLACTVTVPEPEEATPSKGMNLALVLDASGSMSGHPLMAAKQAASLLIEQLGNSDVLSVVSFASDVTTHLSQCVMNDTGKARALDAVRELETRDMTNLAGGWFQGATEVTEALESHPGKVNHILLLSDGHANQGVLDPVELALHARELHERGVGTSAVGIGEGYSMDQLHALSEAGGGRLHDAQHPHEIAEVVLAELGEVRRTVVEEVSVILETATPLEAGVIESYPLKKGSGEVTAMLGSMAGGTERTVIWMLELPAGEPEEEVPMVVRCQWKSVDAPETRESRGVPIRYKLDRARVNNEQERNIAISQLVAAHWHAQILKEAMTLNREGAYKQAIVYVSRQRKHFAQYCNGLPGTQRLLKELEHFSYRVGRRFNERSRKEVQLWSRKSQRGEQDYRSTVRDSYSAYLEMEDED